MALTFFDDVPLSSDDLEFYGDWVKGLKASVLKTKPQYEVIEILKAKSGKGYLVKTTDFACWLWKKQKLTNQLIEALESYCKNGGYSLFVVAITDKQDGYRIACDKEMSSLWYTDGKKYSKEAIPEEQQETGENPFL